ncbi:hypothetical protein K440DRAFT_589586 [Wilcoxina mikolae CBS 423.85]|nr:hypothetical protein K440DRAFT_589586 [Wilcoxina mikolae CBS 423.85]
MAPRRSHKKSRAGCLKCKKRRIKCDETHPNCGNCVKHAIVCDFSLPPEERAELELQQQQQQQQQSSSSRAAASNSPAPQPPQPQLQPHPHPQHQLARCPSFHGVPTTPPDNINIVDLSLMHHWATSTADTISNRPNVQVLWRVDIPTLAVHHPFLMHTVLAISALHLCTKEPARSGHYLPIATRHHDRAVRGMAACLAHISRDNCDALVVSSCLVVIYSFVSSRIDESATIASWVPLLRGVHSILKQAWAWVAGGPLSPLITQYELSSPSDALDAETEGVLSSLYRLCTDRTLPGSEELSDTSTSTAYFSAIAELRKSFATIMQWESINGNIFVWPITATDKFVELLVERRPRALVIFMHYCALFTLIEEFWWCKGSAMLELRRCEMCLSQDWLPWIEWPKTRILERDVEKVMGKGSPIGAGAPGRQEGKEKSQ